MPGSMGWVLTTSATTAYYPGSPPGVVQTGLYAKVPSQGVWWRGGSSRTPPQLNMCDLYQATGSVRLFPLFLTGPNVQSLLVEFLLLLPLSVPSILH